MRPVTNGQIRAIHVQTKALRIDGDIYREMLETQYKVRSSKQLTFEQATKMVATLNQLALGAGLPVVVVREPGTKKYSELEHRDPMYASPAQLRMIEAMWADVSRQRTTADRARALSSFLERIIKRSHITMVERRHVKRIVQALEAMKARIKPHSHGDANVGSSSEEGGEGRGERSGVEGDRSPDRPEDAQQ